MAFMLTAYLTVLAIGVGVVLVDSACRFASVFGRLALQGEDAPK